MKSIEQLSKLNEGASTGIFLGINGSLRPGLSGKGIFAELLNNIGASPPNTAGPHADAALLKGENGTAMNTEYRIQNTEVAMQGDASFASGPISKVVTAVLAGTVPGLSLAKLSNSNAVTEMEVTNTMADSVEAVASKLIGMDLVSGNTTANGLSGLTAAFSSGNQQRDGAGSQPEATVLEPVVQMDDPALLRSDLQGPTAVQGRQQPGPTVGTTVLQANSGAVDGDQPETGAIVNAEVSQPVVDREESGPAGQLLPVLHQASAVAGVERVLMVSYPVEHPVGGSAAARPGIGDKDRPYLVKPVTLQAEQRPAAAAVTVSAVSPEVAVESEDSIKGLVITTQMEQPEGSQRETRLGVAMQPAEVQASFPAYMSRHGENKTVTLKEAQHPASYSAIAGLPQGKVEPGAVVAVEPGSNLAGQEGGGGLTAVEHRLVVGREGNGPMGETGGIKNVVQTDQPSVVNWEPESRLGTASQPVIRPGSPAIAILPETTTWLKTSAPGTAQGEYQPAAAIATRHPVVIEQVEAAISKPVLLPGGPTVTNQITTNQITQNQITSNLPEQASSRTGAVVAGEMMLNTNGAVLPEVGQPQYQQLTGLKLIAAEQLPLPSPANAETAEFTRLAGLTMGTGDTDGSGVPQHARAVQGTGAAQARPEAVAAQENSVSRESRLGLPRQPMEQLGSQLAAWAGVTASSEEVKLAAAPVIREWPGLTGSNNGLYTAIVAAAGRETINKRLGTGTTQVKLQDSKPVPALTRLDEQLTMLASSRYSTGGASAGKDGDHGSVSVNLSENQVAGDPGPNVKRANSIAEKPLFDTLMMNPSVSPKEPISSLKPESVLPQPQLEPLIETLRVMLRQGRSRAEVELNPPQWGKVQLAVEVVRQGLVTIRLLVEQEAACRALQAQIPQLRQVMAEQGIQIQQIDVSLTGGQHWAGNTGYGQQQNFTGRDGQRKMVGQNIGIPVEVAPAALGAGHSGIDYRV